MKLLRLIFKSIVNLIILFLIVWIFLAAILNTKKVQEWALTQSQEFLNKQTDLTFQLGRIEFIFPLSLRAHNLYISKEQDPLAHFQELTLSLAYSNAPQLSVTGSLAVPKTPGTLSFTATSSLDEWKHLFKKIPLKTPIEGNLSIDNTFLNASVKSKFRLLSQREWELSNVIINSPNFHLEGQSTLTPESIQQSIFKGQIKDLPELPGNTIQVEGTIQGPFSDLLVSLQAQSPQLNIEHHQVDNVHSSVRAHLTLNTIQGQLDATFESNKIPSELSTDFHWDHTTNRFTFTNLHLEALQSKAKGEFSIDTTQFIVTGYLQADHFNLKTLSPELNGEIDLILKLNNNAISASFSGNELQFQDTAVAHLQGNITHDSNQKNGLFHLEGRGEFKEEWQLATDGTFDYTTIDLAQLEGSYADVPLNLIEPVHIHFDSEEIKTSPIQLKWGQDVMTADLTFFRSSNEIALNIEAEGELDSYLQYVMHDLPNLTGQAKLAVKVSGKLNAPQIKGTLAITNGTYESMDTGALYHNIDAYFVGEGETITLTSFKAEDKMGGRITANGIMTVDPQRQFPFELQIQPSHISIIDSDYASLSASGQLTLAGITQKAKLQGHLILDHAFINLEEALPKQIKSIDIAYINLAGGEKPPITKPDHQLPIELDVTINANDKVVIEGNHLKSEWKGEFQLTGTPDKPLLFGELRIAHGEYDLNGKIFTISQGTIHFSGSPDKKTTLYVVASKEIDPIKAEMIVKGPLSNLEVSFRSNPPLAQREILSYILFNRGISDISAGEGERLNQSFVTLNASDQKSDINLDMISKLRSHVGLDRLDFTAVGVGENKEYGVQIGKYIREDILVSINKSINAGPDRVGIEAKLMKNVKAQAEVEMGSGTQGKVSLKWKRDY